MELTVKNLGPIDHGKLELDKFTLICGANNSGKTYLAYTIYGFLRYCHAKDSVNGMKKPHPVLDEKLVNKLLTKGIADVRIDVDRLLEYDKELLNHLCLTFKRDLPVWFEGYDEEFKGTKINFSDNKVDARKRIEKAIQEIADDKVHTATVSHNDGRLVFSVKADGSILEIPGGVTIYLKQLIKDFDKLVFRQVEWNPFIITSERMGVSLFYKELDAYRNGMLDRLRNRESLSERTEFDHKLLNNTSKYSKPISEEIAFARELDYVSKKQGKLVKKNKFHRWIEKMLNAKYETDEHGTYLLSLPGAERHFEIPLYRASASARELSHLYHYLRHSAARGDLLIIDEPESHLSSSNQVLLVRMLSECINADIRVLITTHSEIILNEINHLIMLNELKGKDRKTIDKESPHYKNLKGIPKNMISAYYCDLHSVFRCRFNETGVSMPKIDETLVNMDEDGSLLGSLVLGEYND